MKSILYTFTFIFFSLISFGQAALTTVSFYTSSAPNGPTSNAGVPITIFVNWNNNNASGEWLDDIKFTFPAPFTPILNGSADLSNGSNVSVSGQTITFGTFVSGGSGNGPISHSPIQFVVMVKYPAIPNGAITANYSFDGDGFDMNASNGKMAPTNGSGTISNNVPLPIYMSDLKLNWRDSKNINLNFKIFNSLDINNIDIEYSKDGIQFQKIDKLTDFKIQSSIQEINYLATNEKSEINYYRISITDNKNFTEFSNIVSLANQKNNTYIKDFQNIIYNNLNFKIISPINTVSKINIFDIFGNVVYSRNENIYVGENLNNINISNLANGMYYLQLTNLESNEILNSKFIKQ